MSEPYSSESSLEHNSSTGSSSNESISETETSEATLQEIKDGFHKLSGQHVGDLRVDIPELEIFPDRQVAPPLSNKLCDFCEVQSGPSEWDTVINCTSHWILHYMNLQNISHFGIIIEDALRDKGVSMDLTTKQTLSKVEHVAGEFCAGMGGKFETFLCFDGNLDQAHLQRFKETEWKLALEHIKDTNEQVEQILNAALTKLNVIIVEENFKIIEAEEQLINEACEKIVETFNRKLTYIDKHGPEKIEDIKKVLRECFVNIMEFCMDSGGKRNGVLLRSIENLDADSLCPTHNYESSFTQNSQNSAKTSISMVIHLKPNSTIVIAQRPDIAGETWKSVCLDKLKEFPGVVAYNPQHQEYSYGTEAAMVLKSFKFLKDAWKICDLLTSQDTEGNGSNLLINFFRTLKSKVERQVSGGITAVLFVVPDNFEEQHQQRLFRAVKGARISHNKYILTESHALAYGYFGLRDEMKKNPEDKRFQNILCPEPSYPLYVFSSWLSTLKVTVFGMDKGSKMKDLESVKVYAQKTLVPEDAIEVKFSHAPAFKPKGSKGGRISKEMVSKACYKIQADLDKAYNHRGRNDLSTCDKYNCIIICSSEKTKSTIAKAWKAYRSSERNQAPSGLVPNISEPWDVNKVIMLGASWWASLKSGTLEQLELGDHEDAWNLKLHQPSVTVDPAVITEPKDALRLSPELKSSSAYKEGRTNAGNACMISQELNPAPVSREESVPPERVKSSAVEKRQNALLEKCQRMKDDIGDETVTFAMDFLKVSTLEQIESAMQIAQQPLGLVTLDTVTEMEKAMDELIDVYSFPYS